MTRCAQASRWFGAYWDDEVTQAEREWLESHFSACATCRQEYEEFARTLEWVAALPRREAAPDFVDRTLARARRTAPEADRFLVQRPAWVPVLAAACVLIVTAALVAPWIMRGVRPGMPILTPTASIEPRMASRGDAASSGGVVQAPTLLAGNGSEAATAALVDSLIDHTADVDFVLDPVRVSRGRTASGRPAGRAQGQQAVISF